MKRAEEEVYVSIRSISSPSYWSRRNRRESSVYGRHGCELARHHLFPPLANGDLEKERLLGAILLCGKQTGCPSPVA